MSDNYQNDGFSAGTLNAKITQQKAEIEKLKKKIHHMVACCGNPDKDEALRNVIKIGQETLEK